MAAALLQEISQDERERAILRSRRMYETDMTSNLLTAERRGEIRGRKEGREESNLELARNALAEGLSAEMIHKITGLDLETIKKLNI